MSSNSSISLSFSLLSSPNLSSRVKMYYNSRLVYLVLNNDRLGHSTFHILCALRGFTLQLFI